MCTHHAHLNVALSESDARKRTSDSKATMPEALISEREQSYSCRVFIKTTMSSSLAAFVRHRHGAKPLRSSADGNWLEHAMVRVVYRWHVTPEYFEAFREKWRETTNQIHASVAGALGSFMLRSTEDNSEVVTVAKWDSLTSWQDFWVNSDPDEMRGMRRLGKRISVEAFEEIEDHTR